MNDSIIEIIDNLSVNDYSEAREILEDKYEEVVTINEIYEEDGKIYVEWHFMINVDEDEFDTECILTEVE